MSQIKATISGFSLLLATTSLLGIVDSRPVTAQSSVVPATNVTGVAPQGNQINISGGERSSDGTNLFHTFTEFGLNSGQVANFLSSPETLNIFSRVTGGNPSIINGQLQVTGGNTNLFLMNPAGVVFGSGATLNIPGDFTATTATGIGFGENRWLNATGTNDYSNLSGTPNTFAFGSTQPGAIINEAALSVSAGQDLTLLGGTVVSTKILEAPGGNITIAAVPGENLVRITPEGQALSLEVTPIPANSGITPPPGGFTPSPTIAQLITGGNVSNATSLSTNAQGQVELKGSGVTVTDGDIAVQNIRTNENLGLGSSGSVTMSAPGKISTGNINTSNEAGSGGAVSLSARGGISTGNINTSSSGDAGDVTLSTQGAVRIRNNINAMSSTGNGGDVELTAASADYNNIKTNGSISRNGNTPCLIGLCNNPGTDPVDNPPVEEPNPTQGGSEPDEEVPISTPVEEPQPQPTPVEEPNPAQGAPVDNPTTEEPDTNEGGSVDNPPTTEEPDSNEGAPVDNPPTTEEP
ncbi:MAG: filamentous hemagglutinin N-terminal domain-containing protein, partial [Kastovskya adunca ATA6-11-RM4]|nr:filamentous hemagglutinin N-terminal domain-containing protein [Kastovskya adunca ATA6-11-RM4]